MNFFDLARFAPGFSSGIDRTTYVDPPQAFGQTSQRNQNVSGNMEDLLDGTRTERILQLAENSSTYLESGQYDEAFGLLQALYELGPDVQFATVLIDNWVTAMATDRPEKAKKSKEDLYSLMEEHFKVDTKDVCLYALKKLLQKNYFKAILFSQLSSEMLKDEENSETIIHVASACIASVSDAAKNLIEQKKLMKSYVKKHILPQLYEMKELIDSTNGLIRLDKETCVAIGTSSRYIAQCENAVGEEERELKTLKRAIIEFQSVLGKEAAHQDKFRECLKILAARHLNKERFREAAKAYSDAIEATKRANNFSSPLIKSQEIAQLEAILFHVRARLQLNL